MLLSFQLKNYRSILDVTIPMGYAEKKAPNGYKQMELMPFLEKQGVRTVPCLAIYGANASGKSNILQALASLVTIIRSKYDPNSILPNMLHPNNDITSFMLDFMAGDRIFQYLMEVDRKEIIREELIENGELLYSINNRTPKLENLSTEVYPSEKLNTIFSVECLDREGLFRAPFISVIGKNYSGLHESMSKAFDFLSTKLEVHSSNAIPFNQGLSNLANSYDEPGIQKAFEEIVENLRKLDIDITRMEYKRDTIQKTDNLFDPETYELELAKNRITSIKINSYHDDALGNEVQFNFSDESAGTQRIACLLGVVMAALRTGVVLVVDELGNSLHPLLSAEIVRMFKDKRYNTSNAQLIFTTHNTDIMEQDMMRVSEIGFVSRTMKKGTIFTRVSDFQGIRNVTNFRKQYLQGSFSGIPYPYI